MASETDQLHNRKNPTAAKLRRLVPDCPVCHSETGGHRYAQIASTVITDENRDRVLALHEHVKKHQWDALPRFQDFKGDVDDVVVVAIKGPHSEGLVILIRDPSEYWAGPELYLEERVNEAELAEINKAIPHAVWNDL